MNEPVQVFVRIRPENIAAYSSGSPGGGGGGGGGGGESSSSSGNSGTPGGGGATGAAAVVKCVMAVDDRTVRLMPSMVDGRKSVSAVDDKLYTFDCVFPESSTQELLYDSVSNHVKATVAGYNTTIFAYGSTGSGKSHTMTGNIQMPGIIPRVITEFFTIIETTAAAENDVMFYVRLSYVELYNNNFRNLLESASKELAQKEKILIENRDAQQSESDFERERHHATSPSMIHPGLATNARKDKIEVRESQSAGVFLAGPNLRIPVTTAYEAFKLINQGNKLRAVGYTQCNDSSSR